MHKYPSLQRIEKHPPCQVDERPKKSLEREGDASESRRGKTRRRSCCGRSIRARATTDRAVTRRIRSQDILEKVEPPSSITKSRVRARASEETTLALIGTALVSFEGGKNSGKMAGLMAQHPNQDTTLAKPRAMQKPVIKEYDPHVGGNHSGRQWYTLVRLDEYGGVGHIASDDELRELEELILSEPDSSEDDGLETLTGTDAGEDSVGLTGSDFGDAVQAMSRQQVAAYQKPGGPCDHCGAIGA